jgi:hypothetical protein
MQKMHQFLLWRKITGNTGGYFKGGLAAALKKYIVVSLANKYAIFVKLQEKS